MNDKDFDKYIASLYNAMELELIASMKRNLGLHEAEETEYEFNYPQWQAIKLKELRRYQRENSRIIKGVTGRIPKSISTHIKSELNQGRKSEMKRFREAFGDKYKQSLNLKDSFFRINERKVNALIDAVNDSVRTANSAALRMTNDVYRDVIFKTGFFLANGVKTPQQAVDMALKDFLSRGINCIEYKDGRRVNIADYTSMAIRTANQRAFLIGEGERRQRMGVPFIRISQHNTSCPLCRPFERKVLIDDVFSGGKAEDGEYMLLSEAMARGLFHPRCRHGTATFFPDMEEEFNALGFDYTDPDNPVNDYGSKEVNAAHIDNMIQRYKRLSLGYSDPENVAKYEERLRYWKERKDELEAVDNGVKRGIIDTGDETMGLSIEIDRFTPCLIEKSSGKIINTKYSEADKTNLKSLRKKGWNFNWLDDDLKNSTVYKLCLESDSEIQGLIAVTEYPKDKALYINIAESAPHNLGKMKKYEGVGGHLFAIAANESLKKGYGGFLFLDAKNIELVDYYREKFGAILLGMPHPYRMFIDEENAARLLKVYTLKGE